MVIICVKSNISNHVTLSRHSLWTELTKSWQNKMFTNKQDLSQLAWCSSLELMVKMKKSHLEDASFIDHLSFSRILALFWKPVLGIHRDNIGVDNSSVNNYWNNSSSITWWNYHDSQTCDTQGKVLELGINPGNKSW